MTEDKETLREAVARAICLAGRIDPDELSDETGRPMWQEFLPDADAAIATMLERLRTPSEGMIEAGAKALESGSADSAAGWWFRQASQSFQAMLTAFQQENSDA